MSKELKLGNYILGETLGVGSFGKVKLATHCQTNHKVALKIIPRKRINKELASRVKREIQYLKLLRHPHIIKLYEVISTPTDIIMVMEYVSGELFNYIVDHRKMSEEVARKFFIQIISAVEFCHRHKICHRDLKPENLLLDSNENVKIGDFGLANYMADGNLFSTSCGSPNYAAPEVISGKLYAGPEVDVWSCGIILYVMLTGKLPFDDVYIPSLFKKINDGAFQIPSYVSKEAADLLRSLIVVNPLDRITLAEAAYSPWVQAGVVSNILSQSHAVPSYGLLNEINMDAVKIVSEKLKVPVEKVLKIVEKLSPIISEASVYKSNGIMSMEDRNIAVAYQLVLNTPIHNQASPPPWNNSIVNLAEGREISCSQESFDVPVSTSILLSNSFPRKELKQNPRKYHPHYEIDSKCNGSKWHLGIRSKSSIQSVLLEIYKTLKRIGVSWINESNPYLIRAKYKDLLFNIQLYKMPEADFKDRGFLVDFRNMGLVNASGGMMAKSCLVFLELMSVLIAELTVN